MKQYIRIGAGAGFSGDRIEPAVDLAARGQLDYLVFECLAERTIALAQGRKARDPESGYDPLLEERMSACLPICHQNKCKIISNMGAANPLAAMRRTAEIARGLGLTGLTITAVTGDDVWPIITQESYTLLESGAPLSSLGSQVVSANAYLGVEGIIEALASDADIVLTGRVADPALFLAPLIFEFGWSMKDYPLLGQGTTLGHLMECAGQVSGGYFADPGLKDVPGLAELGFPIAEVSADGNFIITKLPETGGRVTPATCKEQLLYEIHDPEQYFTPDVVADFSQVTIEEIGLNRVQICGGRGKGPTGLLKVSVGYRDGFMGEGQISYGGSTAVARARLALDIVRARLENKKDSYEDLRFDIIGINTLYGDQISTGQPYEARIRVSGKATDPRFAAQIGREVESLYTNGPAGGGGVYKSVQECLAVQSILIDRKLAPIKVHSINL